MGTDCKESDQVCTAVKGEIKLDKPTEKSPKEVSCVKRLIKLCVTIILFPFKITLAFVKPIFIEPTKHVILEPVKHKVIDPLTHEFIDPVKDVIIAKVKNVIKILESVKRLKDVEDKLDLIIKLLKTGEKPSVEGEKTVEKSELPVPSSAEEKESEKE